MLKPWWPYKAITLAFLVLLAGANGFAQLDVVADALGFNDIFFTDGVRAAMFAMIAAATLFIALLPRDDSETDVLVGRLSQLCSVIAAFLAGLFWLMDETGRQPGPYIIVLLAVTGALSTFLVITIAVEVILQRIRKEE